MSAPTSGGSPLDRASAWVRTHRGAAAGGAGAVGVLGLALYRRHAAGAGGAAASGANTAGSPATGTVAGIQGDPTDSRTEIENWVADQLTQQQDQINAELAAKKPASNTRKPVTPAPRPGSFRYTVRKGDTLAKIAQRLFGEHNARTINALKHANPILGSFGDGAGLDYYAGHSIAVPKLPLNPTKPKPKPRPRKPRPPHAPGRPKGAPPRPVKRRR